MRQLSNWALHHVVYARLVITLCHVVICWLGMGLAFFLSGDDAGCAPWLLLSGIALTVMGFLAYPRNSVAENYLRRKLCDIALCTATLLLMMGATTSLIEPATRSYALTTQPLVPVAGKSSASLSREVGRSGIFRSLIRLKHSFQQLRQDEKVGLVILTIFVTVVVILLWAALCCVLGCSGFLALAIILAVGGTAGAIYGCVSIIRNIRDGPRRRRAY